MFLLLSYFKVILKDLIINCNTCWKNAHDLVLVTQLISFVTEFIRMFSQITLKNKSSAFFYK